MHTATVLGAGLALAELARAGRLPGRVRLIFQPAEEVLPGGAPEVIAAGGLDGVGRIFALHCDPQLASGQVGLRSGPITAAADQLEVRLTGPGGHTARPHLTVDLVHALGRWSPRCRRCWPAGSTRAPGVASSGGASHAGRASNAIPADRRGRAAPSGPRPDAWDGAATWSPS